uniref:Sushi domain-containing protein n=2 Tax=Ciona savignyi TaxID=51511 RepID=H2ZPS8_CIOSA
MKLLIFFVAATAVGYASGLQCLTCQGNSIADCDKKAVLTTCFSGQNACETVVRRTGKSYHVIKQCKQPQACLNNKKQNSYPSGPSTQCNSNQQNSFCTCCCNSDKCNRGDLKCNLEPGTCAKHPAVFSHGDFSCSNNNLEGSTCEFSCTGDNYAIYPAGNQTTTCLGDGQWNQPAPCCARPCPPYFLYDSVTMFHSSFPELAQQKFDFGSAVGNMTVAAPDALQLSAFQFSGEPHVDSLMSFKQLGDRNAERRLVTNGHNKNTADGKTNIGAALRYAKDVVLTPEMGVRDSRVPKMIRISTDANSDDDAVSVARQLRAEGILIYIVAYEPPTGTLDLKQFYDIVGDRNHLMVIKDNNTEEARKKFTEDIISHFCQNPCDHVLHEHI